MAYPISRQVTVTAQIGQCMIRRQLVHAALIIRLFRDSYRVDFTTQYSACLHLCIDLSHSPVQAAIWSMTAYKVFF